MTCADGCIRTISFKRTDLNTQVRGAKASPLHPLITIANCHFLIIVSFCIGLLFMAGLPTRSKDFVCSTIAHHRAIPRKPQNPTLCVKRRLSIRSVPKPAPTEPYKTTPEDAGKRLSSKGMGQDRTRTRECTLAAQTMSNNDATGP